MEGLTFGIVKTYISDIMTDTSQNNRYERGSEGYGYFDLVSAIPVAVRSPRFMGG